MRDGLLRIRLQREQQVLLRSFEIARAVLGDAQSKAEIGAGEVEKFNEAGVAAIVGAYSSGISLATTQAAAKYGIPHVVDVGVNDKIVGRGLTNTFRFGPGFGVITQTGVDQLIAINGKSASPAKSVVIVHENTTPFGSFMAGLMKKGLEPAGFEVLETLPHPTPNKDFLLRDIVRASTAAPTYFKPEGIEVGAGQLGAFVDGGVSPHNNPSLQSLMYATLSGYNVGWPMGEDKIFLVSVGTGSRDPSYEAKGIEGYDAIKGVV